MLKLVPKTRSGSLTSMGPIYNGRVITMWLGDCMERAAAHRTTNNRYFGQWLHARYQNEGKPWPDDDDVRFGPICLAMIN